MPSPHDFRITPVPAFRDNYIWLLDREQSAAVVDPGDALPVIHSLEAQKLSLTAILVTHHHADHSGGVRELKRRYGCTVYGPAREKIAGVDRTLAAGDQIDVLGVRFDVLDIPGHTAGHIAYFTAAHQPPLLFCGDTLFACGCGRLFEGTAQQMLDSLDALARLPNDTRVYCGHEYTLDNIRFALTVEPDNTRLHQRREDARAMRERGEPTLPSTIGLELATNPFLRSDIPSVRRAAAGHHAGADASRVSTFAALREWKNVYS